MSFRGEKYLQKLEYQSTRIDVGTIIVKKIGTVLIFQREI